ncbi:MAG TPA: hypothetical protein VN316_00090 [candidate division Zixibacteria bacterium]|nr:hypothetical protein [candidate division Zixibacteria bacterium]
MAAPNDFAITNGEHHYPIVFIGTANGFHVSTVRSLYDYRNGFNGGRASWF